MTYAANIGSEGIESQYLAVFKPRRFMSSSSWTLLSGTKYTQGFDYGEGVILEVGGAEETLATTSSLSDGAWFYDSDADLIYIDIGSDPSASDVVVTYEMWFGTFDAHFPRIPTSDESAINRPVYYEPMISRSPQISSSASDALFGFLPSQSTSISMSNATHLFEKHIYDSSFYQADIDLYHYLGELTKDNIKLVYRGVVKSISMSDDSVSFNLLDRTNIFLKEYRNATGVSFYNETLFPALDPTFNGRPIRNVYGVVDGFVPVNVDYDETPSTTVNRTYVCISDETSLGSVSSTVPASPVSTATRTYVTSADGLRVGDSVWIDSSAGAGSDMFPHVTVVNKTGAHYIEHDTIATPAANASVVKRSFVGSVTLFKENVAYDLRYGKDYTEYSDATNKVAGFTLADNFEALHSIANPLEPYDTLYARVYGHLNTVTLGGSPFGTDSAETGTLTNAVVILFDLLKNLGLEETEINTATLTALEATVTDELGFSVPQASNQDFNTYKTLVTAVMQTVLGKFYLDDDLKWTVSITGPRGAVDKIIEKDEILDGTISYDFDYQDIISDVIVEYAFREINEKHQATNDSYARSAASSTVASRLHKVEAQMSFQSLHFVGSEADTLASHLRYALGDRQGRISFKTKNRFFDVELGQNINVTRAGMPGFDYDIDIDRSREAIIISSDKSLTSIDLTMDDQKGIEDNSGSW